MLPAPHRMRHRDDFTAAVRRGRRAGRPTLVVHALATQEATTARVGLVVSRAVGGSVVRHRVARRLRAQLHPRLPALPTGSLVVVRALPSAADASSASLGRDLEQALGRALAGVPS